MIEFIGYSSWILLNVFLTYYASAIASAAWDVKYPDGWLIVAALVWIAIAFASWYGLYSSPLLAPYIVRMS